MAARRPAPDLPLWRSDMRMSVHRWGDFSSPLRGYASVDEAKAAIDRYFAERTQQGQVAESKVEESCTTRISE